MRSPDSVLLKVLGFMWSLAPSQTAGWFMISLIVLVILLVLIFAAGCILIARLETGRGRASTELGPVTSCAAYSRSFATAQGHGAYAKKLSQWVNHY